MFDNVGFLRRIVGEIVKREFGFRLPVAFSTGFSLQFPIADAESVVPALAVVLLDQIPGPWRFFLPRARPEH